MGIGSELLKGLCSDGLWKYAVFWSLKGSKNMILSWGDGYIDKRTKDTQLRDPCADLLDSESQIISPTWSNNCFDQSYQLCPIEAALLSMPSHSYYLGEEIVGKVLVTGEHCWISVNELRSTSMYKYHEDWQRQFAAGIKTVLLVPVIPHGVLHLGSLYTVLESSALVALMKDLFYKFYDSSIPHNSSATWHGFSNTLIKPVANSLVVPPDILAHDLFDLIKSSSQLLTIDHISLPHQFTMSEFPVLEDVITGSCDTGLAALPYQTVDANESDLWTNFHEESSELTHCNTMLEPDMTNLSNMDNLSYSNSQLSCKLVVNIEDTEYDNINGVTLTFMAQEYQDYINGGMMVLNDEVVASNYSVHPNMHKDLGAMSREELENFMCHSSLQSEETTSMSPFQVNGNGTDFFSHLANNDYTEFLLDAITDQVVNIPNSDSSHSKDSLKFCETQIESEDHALSLKKSSVPYLPGGQELSATSVNEAFMSSQNNGSFPKKINKAITENVLRGNSVETKGGCSKIEQMYRPRPRDRQLIQDRMKELRELIPNASKCSIDALLERTITHMSFLQSVSKKAADKLQSKTGNEEFSDEANEQLESCPLRVEELEQPGQLLIEILCKEYQVFFETAHLFKGLEVSILKGELEHRSDKLWARFVIQASQGLNQMQILCPLMYLLQRR